MSQNDEAKDIIDEINDIDSIEYADDDYELTMKTVDEETVKEWND